MATHRGQFHSFENVTSLPRPTQKPRPKFYIAATQTPESFEFAGSKGYSLMAIPIGPIGGLIELYRKSWREAGHPGDGEVMVAFHMFCHEDPKLAREVARPPFEEYFRALNEAAGDWERGSSKDYRDYDTSMRRLRAFTLEGQIEAGGAWVGTPDEIKAIIRKVLGSIGKFEQASLQINFGNIDIADAQKSMRLFAREVMPEFADEAPCSRRSLAQAVPPIESATAQTRNFNRKRHRTIAASPPSFPTFASVCAATFTNCGNGRLVVRATAAMPRQRAVRTAQDLTERTMRQIGHFIGGKEVAGTSGRTGDVFNPNTGEVQAKVAFAKRSEVEHAIANAAAAQPAWAATNPQRRARVLFKFLELVQKEFDSLAMLLSSEHGKTIPDSKGDIQRGLEVVEFACGIPHLMKGEYTESAGPGIDLFSVRQPLGVVAGITPFNFPAMIPMWKFAPALACGNAFILKPSERDPSVPMRLAELLVEAGLPAGVLNVVNGDKESVDTLLTDPRIQAVGFVGSSSIAEYIYSTGTAHGKRVQCFGGAKNHMVVMPDADIDQAVDALIGAGYGSAGERCMAISVAVPVGQKTADILVEKLIPRVESLKVGPSTDPQADYGPMVTRAHLNKVKEYVDLGVKEGAKLKVDGRNFKLQGYENGNFMGGCLFDDVTSDMRIYKEEIFGPVLSVVRAKDYEEALRLPSEHDYGNGVAIFTRDGDTARDFVNRVQVGMVGVNFAIPVPLAYHTFGGWKRSGFGDLNQHGPDSIRFYTKTKTITSRWPSGVKEGAEFVIPTMR